MLTVQPPSSFSKSLHHPAKSSWSILAEYSLSQSHLRYHPTNFCSFSLGDWMPFIAMFQADCFSHENRSPWLFFFLFFPHSSDSVSKTKPKKGIWQITDASWQSRIDVIGQKTEKTETASFIYVFPPSFFTPGKAKMQMSTPDDLSVFGGPNPSSSCLLPLSLFLPSFPSFLSFLLSFPTSRLNRD